MHFLVAVILVFAENSGSHFLLHLFCFASEQVVKNLPASTENMGSIPGPEGPTCHRAIKPVRHNDWTHALEPGAP